MRADYEQAVVVRIQFGDNTNDAARCAGPKRALMTEFSASQNGTSALWTPVNAYWRLNES